MPKTILDVVRDVLPKRTKRTYGAYTWNECLDKVHLALKIPLSGLLDGKGKLVDGVKHPINCYCEVCRYAEITMGAVRPHKKR